MNERHRQSVTVSGKTVDEAIAEAERELGVSRDRLDITVITEGSKGFLGMRAEQARILAMVVGGAAAPAPAPAAAQSPSGAPTAAAGTSPAAPETPDQAPTDRAETRPRAARSRPSRAPAASVSAAAPPAPIVDTSAAADTGEDEFDLDEDYAEAEAGAVETVEPGKRAQQRQDAAAVAVETLEALLRKMDIHARVSVRTVGDPIVLDVETANGGLLIGRRGETLSALQYLVNVLVGRRTRGWTKVVIDVEHWRAHREETLRGLALRQADRVRQQRRAIALDPMPANERRIIHLALQDQQDIETHSEGEEPNRRLVISLRR